MKCDQLNKQINGYVFIDKLEQLFDWRDLSVQHKIGLNDFFYLICFDLHSV